MSESGAPEATEPRVSDSENRILDAEAIAHIRGLPMGGINYTHALCDSHEALRAALATAEAERDALRIERDGRIRQKDELRARVAALTEALREIEKSAPPSNISQHDAAAWLIKRNINVAARALLVGEPEETR